MSYCTMRNYQAGDCPATREGFSNELSGIDWTNPHECFQPDTWDDNEFNLIVFLPEIGENGYVITKSIDFDFNPTNECIWYEIHVDHGEDSGTETISQHPTLEKSWDEAQLMRADIDEPIYIDKWHMDKFDTPMPIEEFVTVTVQAGKENG